MEILIPSTANNVELLDKNLRFYYTSHWAIFTFSLVSGSYNTDSQVPL